MWMNHIWAKSPVVCVCVRVVCVWPSEMKDLFFCVRFCYCMPYIFQFAYWVCERARARTPQCSYADSIRCASIQSFQFFSHLSAALLCSICFHKPSVPHRHRCWCRCWKLSIVRALWATFVCSIWFYYMRFRYTYVAYQILTTHITLSLSFPLPFSHSVAFFSPSTCAQPMARPI